MNIIVFLIGLCFSSNQNTPYMQAWLLGRDEFTEFQKLKNETFIYEDFFSQYDEAKKNLSSDDLALIPDAADGQTEKTENDEEAILLEEGVELLEDVENPEFGPQSEALKNGAKETVRRTREGSFRGLDFGEEVLDVMDVPYGTVLISVNKDVIIQRTYNKNNMLSSRVKWKNAPSGEEQKILFKTSFLYSSDDENRITEITENDFQKSVEVKTVMNGDAKIASKKTWSVDEEQNRTLIKNASYDYDANGRLLSVYTVMYFDDVQKTEKNVFIYKEGFSEPDERYYENGVLRSFCEYTGEDAKNVTYYFDGGFCVRAFYENGVKVREVFFNSSGS